MKYSKNNIRKWGIVLCFAMLVAALRPVDVWAAAKNFNQKKTIKVAEGEDFVHTQKPIWIKYKAPNNGYITITAKNRGKGNNAANAQGSYAAGVLQLFDSKKKTPLSSEYGYHTGSGDSAGYTVVYGVKKKVSYYLRVQAQGAVSVNCKFTKVSKSSADKKAKAVSLAKNKLAKGIMMAGDHAADWYKVTVPKKQYLHFYYSGKANGQIQLTFSGTYLNKAKRYVVQGSEAEGHAYTIERVQPGNYYVKVERADSLSSGFYTLKWQ